MRMTSAMRGRSTARPPACSTRSPTSATTTARWSAATASRTTASTAWRSAAARLTTETVWDDTDIVHVVFDEIIVPNHQVYQRPAAAKQPDGEPGRQAVGRRRPASPPAARRWTSTTASAAPCRSSASPASRSCSPRSSDDSVSAGFDPRRPADVRHRQRQRHAAHRPGSQQRHADRQRRARPAAWATSSFGPAPAAASAMACPIRKAAPRPRASRCCSPIRTSSSSS